MNFFLMDGLKMLLIGPNLYVSHDNKTSLPDSNFGSKLREQAAKIRWLACCFFNERK